MKKQPEKTSSPVELSIIILTFNSEKDLPRCLDSLYENNLEPISKGDWELFVIDNNSSDNTVVNLERHLSSYPNLHLIKNRENAGFAKPNNQVAKKAKGEFILFLNPDTQLESNSISDPLSYIKSRPEVGALSTKLLLGNGKLDSTCHRGFPTPWNSLCFFSGLTMLFPKSKLFAGYTLGHLDLSTIHEVDAINGAYFLLRGDIGRKIGFFDEDFFWKGEDLDICYRLKELGYKIIYYPKAIVHHYKGSSGGHKRGSKTLGARFDVMRLFYKKHYANKYPRALSELVFLGIKLRYLVAYLTGK